jgi:hypothetical protein
MTFDGDPDALCAPHVGNYSIISMAIPNLEIKLSMCCAANNSVASSPVYNRDIPARQNN